MIIRFKLLSKERGMRRPTEIRTFIGRPRLMELPLPRVNILHLIHIRFSQQVCENERGDRDDPHAHHRLRLMEILIRSIECINERSRVLMHSRKVTRLDQNTVTQLATPAPRHRPPQELIALELLYALPQPCIDLQKRLFRVESAAPRLANSAAHSEGMRMQ